MQRDNFSDMLFVYSFIGIGLVMVIVLILFCFKRMLVDDELHVALNSSRTQMNQSRAIVSVSARVTPSSTCSQNACMLDVADLPPSYDEVMKTEGRQLEFVSSTHNK